MSAWWGWATRWNGAPDPQDRPLAAYEGVEVPEVARKPLRAPTGSIVWRCVTREGTRTEHDTEAEAQAQAETHQGAIWYPTTVELEEPA